jgi:methylthioribose-1-phosphate isomerase
MKSYMIPASYWQQDCYMVLDQLALPLEKNYLECCCSNEIVSAIKKMNLRGAPLIGAAASAGVALFFKNNHQFNDKSFNEMIEKLISTRPTAVNLKNVIDEAVLIYKKNKNKDCATLFNLFKDFSVEVHKRDNDRNMMMGENGANYIAELFPGRRLRVLTHCNAGALATCGYGTALGVIRSLFKKSMIENVWVDETRPYLQGSRITAFELSAELIPHKIITDSTAAYLMSEGLVDIVITGADRVALNGDLANKIGTYSLAVNANYHNIPFFSAMPIETFDMNIQNGSEIIIEERSDEELLSFNGRRIAPNETEGLHIGFDVVPSKLTTALITEKGVVSPVTKRSVAEMLNE